MTKSMNDFPYLSEEETMKFLNYNETSMKNLRNSKALTRYNIGHRYFYDRNELIKLIESSKVYAQNKNEYQKYIVSINKRLSVKEISSLESRFVLRYSKYFLDSIQKLIPESYSLKVRDKYVIDKCFEHNSFKHIAERCNITPTRVAQIFEKAIRVTIYLSSRMKKDYEKNYIPSQEEIELLKKENYHLKSELFEINKNSKFIYDNQNSVLFKSVYDLDISVRLFNVLKVNELNTLGDIVRYEKKDFLRFRNFGSKSLSELSDVLDEFDLKFKK